MKLYDLVTFKQALKRELDTTRIEAEILALQQRIGNIKTQVEVLDVDYLEYLDVCVDYCDTLIAIWQYQMLKLVTQSPRLTLR